MLKLLRAACLPVLLIFASTLLTARACEPFPFGSELMLDAAPMPGSKRIPMIEFEEDGAASIDLWCASVRAQATIGEDSITIVVPNDPQASEQCEPERQARDADLLAVLAQVTNWRRDGEVIELLGATPLRFRLMTN
jgi:META domain